MLCVPALVVAGAAAANTYYGYLPTLGSLLGRWAVDQASPTQVQTRMRAPMHRSRRGDPSVVPAASAGMVQRVNIPATVSGFKARPALVYLPPVYFAVPRPRLPVIELLHGSPGNPQDWTRAGSVDIAADRWARAHGGRAPIIVMPDVNGGFLGDTECVDGTRGRAETYLTVDVVRWAVASLGVSPTRDSWAVGGVSAGGYCALDLGLRHPELYGTVIDLSGMGRPTFRGGLGRLFAGTGERAAEHTPDVLLRRPLVGPQPAIWFAVGGSDAGYTRSVVHTAELARRRGLVTRLKVVPGMGHTWRLWRGSFADALPWTAARLGLDG